MIQFHCVSCHLNRNYGQASFQTLHSLFGIGGERERERERDSYNQNGKISLQLEDKRHIELD